MEALAFWDVRPGADRAEVEHLLEELSKQLGIPTPPYGDQVGLPPDTPRIIAILEDIRSDWADFITPPPDPE